MDERDRRGDADGVPGASEGADAVGDADVFRLKRGFGFLAGAHHNHTAGSPMSQREKAGFKRYPAALAVAAEDESGIGPE